VEPRVYIDLVCDGGGGEVARGQERQGAVGEGYIGGRETDQRKDALPLDTIVVVTRVDLHHGCLPQVSCEKHVHRTEMHFGRSKSAGKEPHALVNETIRCR
jgi:hypothetical protein